MLEEFDKLAIYANEKLSDKEIKRRVNMRKKLIKKMSDEEFAILLTRPYMPQYKINIMKTRNNKKI